jgi:hypothetical protein
VSCLFTYGEASLPLAFQVWKNVGHFKKDKEPSDDLFDRLNTSMLNEYLKTLMDGLSAKVFRTYNASITLQVGETRFLAAAALAFFFLFEKALLDRGFGPPSSTNQPTYVSPPQFRRSN